jgi:diadenosine tetraphosphatase ApaH/serine/threonine PP2A family protein phosphatase
MKLALIADVHANREALEAVLQHAERAGCERHVLLGDYVGYGADPLWVVDCVRSLVAGGAIAVKGNHDTGVAGTASPHMVAEARHVVDWTRTRLGASELQFLQDLPLSVTEGEALFVHANAYAPARWEYVLGRAEAQRSLRATLCCYTFCGHVHEPKLYYESDAGHCIDFVPSSDRPVPMPAHRRWLVLPGSTGQPRDGNPAACYAWFDTVQRLLTFHRIPYDHDTAAAKIRAAGLPDMLATRLADGH